MSTTSTTNRRSRKRRAGRREGLDERRRGSNASGRSRYSYNDSTTMSQPEDRKWSRNKLKQELSSFIAEFSYLTDHSTTQQSVKPAPKNQSNANSPQQNFQVYAAKRETNSSPFEDPELRRKGVGWEDQSKGVVVYNVQEAACSDEPARGRVLRRGIFRRTPKVRANKSRPIRRSTSRDLSCPPKTRSVKRVRRRFSGFRASKSRSRKERTRSCRSITPMPWRRRVRSKTRGRSKSRSCSSSRIKDMPYYVGRRRTREIVVKRSRQRAVFKSIEPCDEPTLVTLFPKTIKRSRRRIRVRSRSRESREPELPCRCSMCKNKYKKLARLGGDMPFNTFVPPCPPGCIPVCAPCIPMCTPRPPVCAPRPAICSPCPPTRQVVPRDCSPCSPNRNFIAGGLTCNRPCANLCYKDCCQPLASRCVRSVCFKFGSVGQCLNSDITHYFHSILDKRVCC